MKYFGALNQKVVDKLNNENIADFLIENNLFIKSEKNKLVFTNDAGEIESIIEVDKHQTTFKYNNTFNITLFEFIKSITKQLKRQLKKDLNTMPKKDFELFFFISDKLEDFELQPSEDLLEDIYESLIKHHWEYILDLKNSFYNKFYEEIFGLDFNNQKSIALNHYKNIFNDLHVTYYIDYKEPEIENDKIEFVVQNKLKAISFEKSNYLNKISSINPFFEYLSGDEIIFKYSYYKKNQIILNEIINYEANKEIMVELNLNYDFEEDYYFTNNIEEKKIFLEYNKIFDYFKSYKFTDTMIRNLDQDKKAHIESLYEFLRVNNLVNKGKSEFIRFLKEEHEIELTKIIAYINYDNRKDFPVDGKKSNIEHDKRVQNFEEKWKKFL